MEINEKVPYSASSCLIGKWPLPRPPDVLLQAVLGLAALAIRALLLDAGGTQCRSFWMTPRLRSIS